MEDKIREFIEWYEAEVESNFSDFTKKLLMDALLEWEKREKSDANY